ncbi:Putative Ca2+/H+ antiporter, TMEM165/GDT1 family [Actinopolyspora alba]|uniref:GDT1 family protein n=1 Tax=Actinopolyspora alba TaxID=673379 RepID=A0A1I2BE12_9ACTN|nr:TMEM165/GDT1 family protein [Actinopolyspora alba]SFE54207.1 Putative Ca2+/H+ antiporter, TMEM165/GDT1 family [Actinopolyspora alba]
MLVSLALSSVAIFVAELGDKSQLLAMTFATRYRAWQVLLGITVATVLVHALSVALGFGIGSALPNGWVELCAGVAFLGFALWTLRGDELDDSGDAAASRRGVRAALLAVTVAFMLAELGDKTMLATVTLATRHDWLGTWLGSTLGMVAADALAIVAGLLLARRLSSRAVRYGAASLFAVFGGWMIISSLPSIG